MKLVSLIHILPNFTGIFRENQEIPRSFETGSNTRCTVGCTHRRPG